MIPSSKIAKIVRRRAFRALDRKYLKITSPEPLVPIQNNFTEMFLKIPSTKIDQNVLNNMATRAKNRNTFE